MKIINFTPFNQGRVRAVFSVLTREGILIERFRLMDGRNGLFIIEP